ncbi:hypothetical protein BpHYR1_032395, partial [Brachionus plicatilis]
IYKIVSSRNPIVTPAENNRGIIIEPIVDEKNGNTGCCK